MATRWFKHVVTYRARNSDTDTMLCRPQCALCGRVLYHDARENAWPKEGATAYHKIGPCGEVYYQQREPNDWISCVADGFRSVSTGEKQGESDHAAQQSVSKDAV